MIAVPFVPTANIAKQHDASAAVALRSITDTGIRSDQFGCDAGTPWGWHAITMHSLVGAAALYTRIRIRGGRINARKRSLGRWHGRIGGHQAIPA